MNELVRLSFILAQVRGRPVIDVVRQVISIPSPPKARLASSLLDTAAAVMANYQESEKTTRDDDLVDEQPLEPTRELTSKKNIQTAVCVGWLMKLVKLEMLRNCQL